MSSIQGSINQLLGLTAAGSAYLTSAAQKSYAAKRGAEYDKAYQAQLDAAKSGYTKTGRVSRSKAAQEARAVAEQSQPGAGSKAPWNKDIEGQLKGQYEKKMAGLGKTVEEGRAKLKEADIKAKEATYQQFGDYSEIAPQILNSMSAQDRWKIKAQQRIMQRDAYNDFLESLEKEGNK